METLRHWKRWHEHCELCCFYSDQMNKLHDRDHELIYYLLMETTLPTNLEIQLAANNWTYHDLYVHSAYIDCVLEDRNCCCLFHVNLSWQQNQPHSAVSPCFLLMKDVDFHE